MTAACSMALPGTAGCGPARDPREPTLTAAPGCPQGGPGPEHVPRHGTWAVSSGRRPGPSQGPALQTGGEGWCQGWAAATSSHSHWPLHSVLGARPGQGRGQGPGLAQVSSGPQGSQRPGGQAFGCHRAPSPGEAQAALAVCSLFLMCPLFCPQSPEHPQTCCQRTARKSSAPALF